MTLIGNWLYSGLPRHFESEAILALDFIIQTAPSIFFFYYVFPTFVNERIFLQLGKYNFEQTEKKFGRSTINQVGYNFSRGSTVDLEKKFGKNNCLS